MAGGDASTVIWGKDGSETPVPTLNARDVAVSDLNRDGFPELIFANYSEGTYGNLDVSSYVYWGSVHGYADARRTDLQTFGAAAVAVGDLNGDNRQDLLFGNTGKRDLRRQGRVRLRLLGTASPRLFSRLRLPLSLRHGHGRRHGRSG